MILKYRQYALCLSTYNAHLCLLESRCVFHSRTALLCIVFGIPGLNRLRIVVMDRDEHSEDDPLGQREPRLRNTGGPCE